MRCATLCIIVLFPMLMTAQHPTMDDWTVAWRNSDSKAFKDIYSDSASIFPPNGATVKGNKAILDYMRAGMGKVDVFFEPSLKIVGESLTYESGRFRDIEPDTKEVKGSGDYAVTWIFENGKWKIIFHTWSSLKKPG